MKLESLDVQEELLYHTRSAEAQEVIGRMPSWIVRYGVSMIAVFLLLIFLLAKFIKYPDTIAANAIIVNSRCSKKIALAKTAAIGELRSKNGDLVSNNQIIAILQDEAVVEDVFLVKEMAQSIDSTLSLDRLSIAIPKRALQLGNLRQSYSDLLVSLFNYRDFETHDGNLKFNLAKAVRENARRLLSAIESWESEVIVRSPQAGRVIFVKPLTNSSTIVSNETFVIVSPAVEAESIITATLPSAFNLKLRAGLPVILKLNNYPYQDFGILNGKISGVIVADSESIISILLTTGMKTSSGFRIPPQSQLTASAEIVTDNKTLLQRLFNKFDSNI